MMDHRQANQTVGGVWGHLFRRSIHLLIAAVPIIYFAYGFSIAGWFRLTPPQLLIAIIILNIIVEGIRLKFKWAWWGHRQRELHYFSSFAWGLLSICLVLLFAPGKQYAIPIIWSCAFGDPLLGELRHTRLSATCVVFISVAFIMAVWFFCTWIYSTPWELALLMGPLIVGLEWPNVKWVDDNALMQLIPLLIVLLLYK